MKKYLITALLISSLLVFAYLLFINRLNISIRMSELAVSLQEIDKNEGNIDHISLIATYEISKKILQLGDEVYVKVKNADLVKKQLDFNFIRKNE